MAFICRALSQILAQERKPKMFMDLVLNKGMHRNGVELRACGPPRVFLRNKYIIFKTAAHDSKQFEYKKTHKYILNLILLIYVE